VKNARTTRNWIRNANDEAAVNEGYWFDEKAAKRVCDFFETCLCHTDGEYAGRPFILLDWERGCRDFRRWPKVSAAGGAGDFGAGGFGGGRDFGAAAIF
jgi:hypothetical protein